MRSGAAHFELFVERDARRHQSQYERELLFRWMQLMGRERGLYNVDNRHRCFEWSAQELGAPPQNAFESRDVHPPHLVRPFHAEPLFFGCLVCARSHFCRGERDTCEVIVTGAYERLELCRYSGRVLNRQDSLQPTYEDTSRRRPSLARHVANSRCPRVDGALRHDPHAKATLQKQRAQKRLKRKADAAAARANKKRVHRPRRLLAMEDYEISVESWDDTETTLSSSSSSSSRTGDSSSSSASLSLSNSSASDSITSADAESLGDSLGGDDDDDGGAVTRKRTRDDDASRSGDGDSDDDDDGGDGDESSEVSLMDACDGNAADEGQMVQRRGGGEDDDDWDGGAGALHDERYCAYQKNYHNNLAYNNEYYDFMRLVCRRWLREKKRARLLARDVRATRAAETTTATVVAPDSEAITTTTTLPDRVFAVSESTRIKISDECALLLHDLLAVQRQLDAKEDALQHYVPLVCAITALVYSSGKLETIARARSRKNQKQHSQPAHLSRQGHTTLELAQLDTLQSDAEYHEFTLCPRKITRALLHYMLVQSFELSDSLGHLVLVWQRDEWLAHATAALPIVEAERRDMASCVTTLRQCLAHYAWCPLWLRAHLLYRDEAEF